MSKDIPADFEFSALDETYYYPRAIIREFSSSLKGSLIAIARASKPSGK